MRRTTLLRVMARLAFDFAAGAEVDEDDDEDEGDDDDGDDEDDAVEILMV